MEKNILFVGMLVTEYVGSDRYPYEVIEIAKDEAKIVVRQMTATPTEKYDYYSNQDYVYTQDWHGREIELSRRKDGKFRPVGTPMSQPSRFAFGYANFYHDPHF